MSTEAPPIETGDLKSSAKTAKTILHPHPVIFLDIDGVLNNTASLAESIYLLPEKSRLVALICEQTKARVVITSEWRMFMQEDEVKGGICPLRFALFRSGFPAKNIIGKTDEGAGWRGQQIDRWIMAHKPLKWIIIDDADHDFDETHKSRLIRTDSEHGLTLFLALKAIKLLTS